MLYNEHINIECSNKIKERQQKKLEIKSLVVVSRHLRQVHATSRARPQHSSPRSNFNRYEIDNRITFIVVFCHQLGLYHPLHTTCVRFKPNTHRRRPRDETVLSRRVDVGAVCIGH